MLDGLREVIAQIALIVAVVALLAGVLGWLLGNASGTRRAERAAAASRASRLTPAHEQPSLLTPAHEQPSRLTPAHVQASPSFLPRHAMRAAVHAPVPLEEGFAPIVPTSRIVDVARPPDAPVLAEAPVRQDLEPSRPVTEPVVEPVVEPVPADTLDEFSGAGAEASSDADPDEDPDANADEDPDRTVLRPAPSMTSASWSPGMSTSGTPLYAPPRFAVATSTLSDSGPTAGRPASMQEVQELRRELRAKELELGRLEAGVFSAWDRTVPHLETQISALLNENASLRRQIRDADEHSAADAKTVERLSSLVAERDCRLAEIRAQF